MENLGITDMEWTETKFSIKQVKKMVENKLSQHFPVTDKEGRKIFHSDNCGDFYICAMGDKEPWNYVVVSYKDSDGDDFNPSNYDSFDAFVADIIEEIETYEPD